MAVKVFHLFAELLHPQLQLFVVNVQPLQLLFVDAGHLCLRLFVDHLNLQVAVLAGELFKLREELPVDFGILIDAYRSGILGKGWRQRCW